MKWCAFYKIRIGLHIAFSIHFVIDFWLLLYQPHLQQFKDDIIIEAQERLQLDVKLRDDQARCLMNLPAFGRAYRLPDGLRSGDILIDKDFDYRKNRITIGFYNSTDKNIVLKRRVPLLEP